MKNFLKVFIIAAGFVLCFNASSFAVWDAAAWGGYVYDGKTDPKTTDFDGGQFGFKGHYNTTVIPSLLDFGIGAYYQRSKLKFDFTGSESFWRRSAGLDANLIVELPVLPLHPYARGTWALSDKIDGKTKNFKAYGVGLGLEFTFFPFIRLFGEYMYEKSNHETDYIAKAVNFGLKLDF